MWMGIFFFGYDKQRGESVFEKSHMCGLYSRDETSTSTCSSPTRGFTVSHSLALNAESATRETVQITSWITATSLREHMNEDHKRTKLPLKPNNCTIRAQPSCSLGKFCFVFNLNEREKLICYDKNPHIQRITHCQSGLLDYYTEALNYVQHRKKKFSGGTAVNSPNNCIKRWIAGGAAHKRTITHLIKCCVSRQIGCFWEGANLYCTKKTNMNTVFWHRLYLIHLPTTSQGSHMPLRCRQNAANRSR